MFISSVAQTLISASIWSNISYHNVLNNTLGNLVPCFCFRVTETLIDWPYDAVYLCNQQEPLLLWSHHDCKHIISLVSVPTLGIRHMILDAVPLFKNRWFRESLLRPNNSFLPNLLSQPLEGELYKNVLKEILPACTATPMNIIFIMVWTIIIDY